MVLKELREFLGRELFATGVEQHERVGGSSAGIFAEFEQRRFIGCGHSFDWDVTRDAVKVVVGEGLDGRVFGSADPGDLEFHGKGPR
jgi:hypothetical protein